MKRRCITLLELMISLGLFSILLTTLLFWYSHLSKQKAIFSKLSPPLFQEYYAYSRLEKILEQTRVVPNPIFFSSTEANGSTSLIFSFDHGIQAEPLFSGPVIAKLYWDATQQALQLTLWPCPKNPQEVPTSSHTYILLDHVKDFKMEFFAPQSISHLPVAPQYVGREQPFPGWQSTWRTTYPQSAALVRLHLQWHHPVQWVFDLHLPMLYPVEAS